MGDRVSRGVPYVQLDALDSILDVDRFLARVTEMRRWEEDRARRQPVGDAGQAEEEREVFRAAMEDNESD
jgi:hypothetical protein